MEYALEAVKQGSATIGARSGTHAVLVGLKRSFSELGAHQQKLFKVTYFAMLYVPCCGGIVCWESLW